MMASDWKSGTKAMEEEVLLASPGGALDEVTAELYQRCVRYYSRLCDVRERERSIPKTAKNVVYLMLCEIAFDHYASILKLVEYRVLVCSAFALYRTLLETTARAIWVIRRGKEQRLRHMLKTRDTDLPDYASIAAVVDGELATVLASGMFALPQMLMQELHSFTHSGKAALSMRINHAGMVTPSYPIEAVHRLLHRSTLCAAVNGIVYSQIMAGAWEELSEDAQTLNELFAELFVEGERA